MGEDFAQTTKLLWQYKNPLLHCKRTKNFPQPPQLVSKERYRFAARENFERAAKVTSLQIWQQTNNGRRLCTVKKSAVTKQNPSPLL